MKMGPEYGNIRVSIHLIANYRHWDTSNRIRNSSVWIMLDDLLQNRIKDKIVDMCMNAPGYTETFLYTGGWWKDCPRPNIPGEDYNIYVEFEPSPRLSMPFDPSLDTVTIVPPCRVIPPDPNS